MKDLKMIPTVILDPYLLISMSMVLPTGALAACLYAHFALCDHIPQGDFLPMEYEQLMQAVDREEIETLSVPAVEIADLLHLRNVLVLNQIASIATARCYGCMFASDCCIFRQAATTVLKPAYVLSGEQVYQRFKLN